MSSLATKRYWINLRVNRIYFWIIIFVNTFSWIIFTIGNHWRYWSYPIAKNSYTLQPPLCIGNFWWMQKLYFLWQKQEFSRRYGKTKCIVRKWSNEAFAIKMPGARTNTWSGRAPAVFVLLGTTADPSFLFDIYIYFKIDLVTYTYVHRNFLATGDLKQIKTLYGR